jgi:hypothetical protein
VHRSMFSSLFGTPKSSTTPPAQEIQPEPKPEVDGIEIQPQPQSELEASSGLEVSRGPAMPAKEIITVTPEEQVLEFIIGLDMPNEIYVPPPNEELVSNPPLLKTRYSLELAKCNPLNLMNRIGDQLSAETRGMISRYKPTTENVYSSEYKRPPPLPGAIPESTNNEALTEYKKELENYKTNFENYLVSMNETFENSEYFFYYFWWTKENGYGANNGLDLEKQTDIRIILNDLIRELSTKTRTPFVTQLVEKLTSIRNNYSNDATLKTKLAERKRQLVKEKNAAAAAAAAAATAAAAAAAAAAATTAADEQTKQLQELTNIVIQAESHSRMANEKAVSVTTSANVDEALQIIKGRINSIDELNKKLPPAPPFYSSEDSRLTDLRTRIATAKKNANNALVNVNNKQKQYATEKAKRDAAAKTERDAAAKTERDAAAKAKQDAAEKAKQDAAAKAKQDAAEKATQVAADAKAKRDAAAAKAKLDATEREQAKQDLATEAQTKLTTEINSDQQVINAKEISDSASSILEKVKNDKNKTAKEKIVGPKLEQITRAKKILENQVIPKMNAAFSKLPPVPRYRSEDNKSKGVREAVTNSKQIVDAALAELIQLEQESLSLWVIPTTIDGDMNARVTDWYDHLTAIRKEGEYKNIVYRERFQKNFDDAFYVIETITDPQLKRSFMEALLNNRPNSKDTIIMFIIRQFFQKYGSDWDNGIKIIDKLLTFKTTEPLRNEFDELSLSIDLGIYSVFKSLVKAKYSIKGLDSNGNNLFHLWAIRMSSVRDMSPQNTQTMNQYKKELIQILKTLSYVWKLGINQRNASGKTPLMAELTKPMTDLTTFSIKGMNQTVALLVLNGATIENDVTVLKTSDIAQRLTARLVKIRDEKKTEQSDIIASLLFENKGTVYNDEYHKQIFEVTQLFTSGTTAVDTTDLTVDTRILDGEQEDANADIFRFKDASPQNTSSAQPSSFFNGFGLFTGGKRTRRRNRNYSRKNNVLNKTRRHNKKRRTINRAIRRCRTRNMRTR